MTEATASSRGFLLSFEAALHLQKSPFSFHNKFETCMCCRRGLIVILRPPTRTLVDGKIAVVKRYNYLHYQQFITTVKTSVKFGDLSPHVRESKGAFLWDDPDQDQ